MTSSIFREIKLTEEEHGKVIDYVTSEEYLQKARKYIKDIKENHKSILDKPATKLMEALKQRATTNAWHRAVHKLARGYKAI